MLKVKTQTFASYSIPQKDKKHSSPHKQESISTSQKKFYDQTFNELKKLNEAFGFIQKTKNSLRKIQSQLQEIDPSKLTSRFDLLKKLSHLKIALPTNLKSIIYDKSLKNLSDTPDDLLQNLLQIEQNKLNQKLNQTTQNIRSILNQFKEFDLIDHMLKDPRFKEAHSLGFLDPSLKSLLNESL